MYEKLELALDRVLAPVAQYGVSVIQHSLCTPGASMSELTDRLFKILERERGVIAAPVVPTVAPDNAPRWPVGTVFIASEGNYGVRNVAMLMQLSSGSCALVLMPYGAQYGVYVLTVKEGQLGPTKDEFKRVYGSQWQVSRRGREALEEWARDEV